MASHQLRPLVGVRFQVLFTPLLAVLFTFPSRYWFAIGLPGVFSLGGWCRRVQRGFLRSPPTQEHDSECMICAYGTLTPCGAASQLLRLDIHPTRPVLQPRPGLDPCGLGFSAFARRYWRNHSCFLLLRVLRCFSSPRLPPVRQDDCPAAAGLPHSDTGGSKRVCRSPPIFAACRVLLRLWEPRYPPYALFLARGLTPRITSLSFPACQ